jgi:hypothetical protein
MAIATAVSTTGYGFGFFPQPTAQATSTAKTSFAGVSVQSTAVHSTGSLPVTGSVTASSEAIAQGGSGQTSLPPNFDLAAISTAVPDKGYATALIGGASNVADALLGPGDEIFGTSILGFAASSTFDFRYQGDLLLGVISGFDSGIVVNGAQIFTGGSVTDAVINLGSNFGPNIDLTIFGDGIFVIGGAVPEAVPEASTWAMLVLGFAGLGLVGYRSKSRVSVRVV